jgi:hypothetical protein
VGATVGFGVSPGKVGAPVVGACEGQEVGAADGAALG